MLEPKGEHSMEGEEGQEQVIHMAEEELHKLQKDRQSYRMLELHKRGRGIHNAEEAAVLQ